MTKIFCSRHHNDYICNRLLGNLKYIVRIVKGDMYFVKESGMTKNVIRITEFGGLDLSQQYLDFRGDNFDADIRVHILLLLLVC
jgi:hypothetical protein